MNQSDYVVSGAFWQWHLSCGLGKLDCIVAGTFAEDVDVEKRVGAEAVCAVHRNAGTFASCIKARHNGVVVAQNFSLDVGWNATHCIVRGWEHWHWLGVWLDT